jgi:uncharacterized membrane protein YkoI
MQRFFPSWVPGALCLLLLARLWGSALAQDASNQSRSLGDLSSFRTIAADALAIVDAGNLAGAKVRIKDLETSWDRAEARLRPRDPERWIVIDRAIDRALAQLRAGKPQASTSQDALQNLLASFDRSSQGSPVAAGEPTTVEPARLSVTDIIAAAEKLQTGAGVLDVSYEPKDGKPAYAVRTYANGKVWDGLLDAISGGAIDQGTAVDESALDAEDKAELAALKRARVTLRQAIASAERASGGRALNAGLEQVRGRAVWEILVQNTKQSQQIRIDPITGKIL